MKIVFVVEYGDSPECKFHAISHHATHQTAVLFFSSRKRSRPTCRNSTTLDRQLSLTKFLIFCRNLHAVKRRKQTNMMNICAATWKVEKSLLLWSSCVLNFVNVTSPRKRTDMNFYECLLQLSSDQNPSAIRLVA